jgi:hypothetical protein
LLQVKKQSALIRSEVEAGAEAGAEDRGERV